MHCLGTYQIPSTKSLSFVNNCFNTDSFSIINENFKLVSTTHSIILDQLEITYYLLQVITQSDFGENQLSIQPLLHGIIFNYIYIHLYNNETFMIL